MNIKDTTRWKNLQVLVDAYRMAKDNYQGDIRDLLTEEQDAQVEELLRNPYVMVEVYRTCGGNLRELPLTLEQKLVIQERFNDHFTEADTAYLLELCKREDDEVIAKQDMMYEALQRMKNRERASRPRQPRRDAEMEKVVQAMYLNTHPRKTAGQIHTRLVLKYGDEAPSLSTVKRIIAELKKNRLT